MSNGNSNGPCHCPIGEISCGVAPLITSNCRSRHALLERDRHGTGLAHLDRHRLERALGPGVAPPGIAYTAALPRSACTAVGDVTIIRLNASARVDHVTRHRQAGEQARPQELMLGPIG